MQIDKADKNGNVEQSVLAEINEAIKRIKFGEIVITIHDGKVVQIEKREKKRFVNKAKRG